jgi:hypothetical protein
MGQRAFSMGQNRLAIGHVVEQQTEHVGENSASFWDSDDFGHMPECGRDFMVCLAFFDMFEGCIKAVEIHTWATFSGEALLRQVPLSFQ